MKALAVETQARRDILLVLDGSASTAYREGVHSVHARIIERARELRQMLVIWLTSKEQMNWTVTRNYQDLEALEQLAALGYTTVAPQRGAREWIDPDCDCERCAEFQ